jgi:uncharacterized protein (DUF427 family)
MEPTSENFELPDPVAEPTERRIRVRLGGRLVADSRRALLLASYGPGTLPTYYLPLEDVRDGALVEEAREPAGDAGPAADAAAGHVGQRFWTVAAGSRRAPRSAWTHPDPSGPLAALDGHVTFSWRALEWYEEDERVLVHARDPYKRVDTLHSSRHVEVFVDGQRIADSIRPVLLFETHLPTRYYLPFEDVRTDLLESSDTVTSCPYKGEARYWSLRLSDGALPDVAWSYPAPIPENPKIRGLVCFYNERVDLVVDGERVERPVTPFS